MATQRKAPKAAPAVVTTAPTTPADPMAPAQSVEELARIKAQHAAWIDEAADQMAATDGALWRRLVAAILHGYHTIDEATKRAAARPGVNASSIRQYRACLKALQTAGQLVDGVGQSEGKKLYDAERKAKADARKAEQGSAAGAGDAGDAAGAGDAARRIMYSGFSLEDIAAEDDAGNLVITADSMAAYLRRTGWTVAAPKRAKIAA